MSAARGKRTTAPSPAHGVRRAQHTYGGQQLTSPNFQPHKRGNFSPSPSSAASAAAAASAGRFAMETEVDGDERVHPCPIESHQASRGALSTSRRTVKVSRNSKQRSFLAANARGRSGSSSSSTSPRRRGEELAVVSKAGALDINMDAVSSAPPAAAGDVDSPSFADVAASMGSSMPVASWPGGTITGVSGRAPGERGGEGERECV